MKNSLRIGALVRFDPGHQLGENLNLNFLRTEALAQLDPVHTTRWKPYT